MSRPIVVASPTDLGSLPIPARPRLDPSDVRLPDGYAIEVVLAGLSMPCGMGVDDGTGGAAAGIAVPPFVVPPKSWRVPYAASRLSAVVS